MHSQYTQLQPATPKPPTPPASLIPHPRSPGLIVQSDKAGASALLAPSLADRHCSSATALACSWLGMLGMEAANRGLAAVLGSQEVLVPQLADIDHEAYAAPWEDKLVRAPGYGGKRLTSLNAAAPPHGRPHTSFS